MPVLSVASSSFKWPYSVADSASRPSNARVSFREAGVRVILSSLKIKARVSSIRCGVSSTGRLSNCWQCAEKDNDDVANSETEEFHGSQRPVPRVKFFMLLIRYFRQLRAGRVPVRTGEQMD